MTSLHRDEALVVETTADAGECLCFARDLDASLVHVVVAAAGRALERVPGWIGADPELGVVRLAADGEEVEVVPVPLATGGAGLPAVRDAVDAALRAGTPTTRPLALVVQVDAPVGSIVGAGSAASPRCLLDVGCCDGDPLTLALRLRVDGHDRDEVAASELLDRVARLLSHPYRRLV